MPLRVVACFVNTHTILDTNRATAPSLAPQSLVLTATCPCAVALPALGMTLHLPAQRYSLSNKKFKEGEERSYNADTPSMR